jgi:hypothetical protein
VTDLAQEAVAADLRCAPSPPRSSSTRLAIARRIAVHLLMRSWSKKLVVASRIDAVRAARAREDATFAYMVGAAANASALGAFLEAGQTP